MRIVHFGDWRGKWCKLPPGDLYICTGNMLFNYPHDGEIIPQHEIFKQGKQIRALTDRRHLFGNPEARVIVLRGHRDFLPLSKLFGEPIYELGRSVTTYSLCGLPRVGGFRGVQERLGVWSDEAVPAELAARVGALSMGINILVTHPPVYGMLDEGKSTSGYPMRLGILALADFINKNEGGRGPLKLHCFSHAAECFGIRTKNGITYSNASGGYTVFEWVEGRPRVMHVVKNAARRKPYDK